MAVHWYDSQFSMVPPYTLLAKTDPPTPSVSPENHVSHPNLPPPSLPPTVQGDN